jgi:hypothetical protein
MIGRVKPTFFPTPATFRAWLSANHATAAELFVGFHKVGSGTPSIWPQSVDEALCFGWIDGVRRSLGRRATRSASRRGARAASGARSTRSASPRSARRDWWRPRAKRPRA